VINEGLAPAAIYVINVELDNLSVSMSWSLITAGFLPSTPDKHLCKRETNGYHNIPWQSTVT
jgi:hypothetical protein